MPLAVQILRGKQRQSRAWEVRWLVRRVAGKAVVGMRRNIGGTTLTAARRHDALEMKAPGAAARRIPR